MIPNKYGRIINLASIAGLFGSSGDMQMVAYNTSKGAVVNFTRALAGLGALRNYGQCSGARLFPVEDDEGHDRGCRCRSSPPAAPLRRTRRRGRSERRREFSSPATPASTSPVRSLPSMAV